MCDNLEISSKLISGASRHSVKQMTRMAIYSCLLYFLLILLLARQDQCLSASKSQYPAVMLRDFNVRLSNFFLREAFKSDSRELSESKQIIGSECAPFVLMITFPLIVTSLCVVEDQKQSCSA